MSWCVILTPKEFAKYLKRDGGCIHCGLEDDTLIPQHRINRQSGGSKKRDRPSNIIVLCSAYNTLIESNANAAKTARELGIKLNSWENPLEVPIYQHGEYWLLDDNFGKVLFKNFD